MPKERKDRSVSNDKYRAAPMRCDSSRASLHSSPSPTDKDIKDWEEARCPVCMEPPHNCILLICSSYENGCRPYMCDTSYRHSNCFDQFRKASKEAEVEAAEGTLGSAAVNPREGAASESTVRNRWEEGRYVVTNRVSNKDMEEAEPKLTCPLCRGDIKKWVVVQAARSFMNTKLRSCSCETCDYSGTYSDLRKHARVEHPEARPSEADPERQLNWRRLEQRRDLVDLLSYMRSQTGEMDQVSDIDDPSLNQLYQAVGLSVYIMIHTRIEPRSSPRGRSSSSSNLSSGRSRARPEIGIRNTSGGRRESRDRRNYTSSGDDGRNWSRGLRQHQMDMFFSDDEHEED